MTALDNVAVWHERDISHSSAERLILPDACIALDYMLDLLRSIYDGLEVSSEAMERNLNLTRGLIYSGQVLLALVESGMARGEAYDLVQFSRAPRVGWAKADLESLLLAADPRVDQTVLAPKSSTRCSTPVTTCAGSRSHTRDFGLWLCDGRGGHLCPCSGRSGKASARCTSSTTRAC